MSVTSTKSSPATPLPFKITDATQLEDWRKWTRTFRSYANSVHLEQECHDVQLCIFKSLVGPDALEIYNTFSLLEITDIESVIRKFDEHFKPKVNLTLERYKLYKLRQNPGQKFDDFLSAITNQVDKCEFRAMRDEIALYKIVGGIDDDQIRNALLADPDLKYDNAIQICRASSAMHFMFGKENDKGTTVKKKELGKTPKISFKEQRKSQLEGSKKDQTADSETKMKTSKIPRVNSNAKIAEKGNTAEKVSCENQVKKQGVEKTKGVEVSNADSSKGGDVIELPDSENVKEDGLNNEDGGSNGDDSDWRSDDCYDYDPEQHSLEKSGARKERQRSNEGITPSKRVAWKKPVSSDNFSCDVCGKKSFRTKFALEKHRNNHTRGRVTCYYCSKELSKFSLRRHMNSHYDIIGCPPPKSYSCDTCNFTTRHRGNFERHRFQHSGEKPLACDLCDYRCIKPRLLRAHVARQHTGEFALNCSVCNKGFFHSDALKTHMVTHMSPEEKVKHYKRISATCDVCGKLFSDRRSLYTHAKLHTGEKPYTCDKCGFRSVTKGNLTIHLRTHSDEKPYVCTVCGYACKQSSVLGQHMKIHTGEKPYACEVCSKKFTQTAHLKTHMLTHTGEKPHVCEICGHGFTTSGSLKAHKKIHEKYSGDGNQYTPPRKRTKKPVAVVVAAPSEESGHSADDLAANAVITWSEQVSAINSVQQYTPSLETPPPPFHPTFPVHQGNPRPPDCRYYQQRQWQNPNYRHDPNQGQ